MADTSFYHFFDNTLFAYLIELIESYSKVDEFITLPYHFGKTAENFAVVNLNSHPFKIERCEHGVVELYELHFLPQAGTTHHIGIALIKLSETSFLRTVGTPYRLNLITFKGESQFILVLYYIACKRNCKVITECFF